MTSPIIFVVSPTSNEHLLGTPAATPLQSCSGKSPIIVSPTRSHIYYSPTSPLSSSDYYKTPECSLPLPLPFKPCRILRDSFDLCTIEEENVRLENNRNEISISQFTKPKSSTPLKVQNSTISSSINEYHSCVDRISPNVKKVDVSVQCDDLSPKRAFDFHYIKTRLPLILLWRPKSSTLTRIWVAVRNFFEHLFKRTENDVRVIDLENRFRLFEKQMATRIDELTVEIEKLRREKASSESQPPPSSAIIPLRTQLLPPPPPPPPPPPLPPPLPPPPIFAPPSKVKTPLVKQMKKIDCTPRISITVEDLTSVKLRKVSDTGKVKKEILGQGGPLVTLEQLRSVKLKSRRKQNASGSNSPTRTPLSRNRIRKMRSPGFRVDRRNRTDKIPLSKILNLDDSF